MIQPKFDLQEIIRTYTPPEGEAADRIRDYLAANQFVSDEGVTALIGTGGTISSAYSPTHENIVPMPSQPAYVVLREIQKWGINKTPFTAVDPFAKDSREVETADLILLLDILSVMENKKIIITSGTYMLPRITELLLKLFKGKGRFIAVTGSMLALGFTANDAGMNVLSASTWVETMSRQPSNDKGAVAAVFHGVVCNTLESLQELNLHPKETEDLCLLYPMGMTPVVPVKQVGAVHKILDSVLGRLLPSHRPSGVVGPNTQNAPRRDR